jgi:hypothetical protein
MLDYMKSAGVDVAKIKTVHVYGGSRVAVIGGDDFRRAGDKITFQFAQQTRGKTLINWPGTATLPINTTFDMISRVAVYIEKPAPTLNEEGDLVLDGKVVKGIPHAPTEESGLGTRVYLDGKLVGAMRRRSLPSKFLMPGTEPGKPARFSVAQYAESLGVDLKKAKAVDVVTGDDVVARMNPTEAQSLAFTVPNHTHGSMLVDLKSATTKVSAIEFFTKEPPARTITAPVPFEPAQSADSSESAAADDEIND